MAVLMSAGLAGCGDGKPAGKPATAEQLVQIGLAALAQKDQAKALTAFEQAASKAPENFYAHYNIGFIRQQQGKPAEALQQYQLALASKPDFVPALYNSGTIYGASDPVHAMTIYRRVIKIDPKYASAYLNLGLLEAANGQAEQGRKDLEKALQLDPSFVSRVPAKLFPNLKAVTPKPSATP
jgi:Tfp pilus assembly protein PilF